MKHGKTAGLALVAAGAVVLGAAACVQSTPRNPQPTPTTAPAPTAQPSATLVPPAASPQPTPTPRPPTPTPQTVPISTVARFGLFLEIEGLSEESVVRGDSVIAKGKTSPDAIISINGVIVPVDSDGNFQVLLTLDPGPNVIEVVASDLDGNELNKVFAVVALPEGVQS